LTMAPSEYFKRQCFVSVECDEEPVKHVIDAIGDDRIVFSTDFPHGDSKFPRAVESFLRLPISQESKRKILWDNCAAYYGLPACRCGRSPDEEREHVDTGDRRYGLHRSPAHPAADRAGPVGRLHGCEPDPSLALRQHAVAGDGDPR